ncbi:MAG: transcription-repair coupling factor [Bacteroidetes bacterium]|nr:transcription-repair coupling factor [Bacteroidota bacterium]
MNSQKLQSSKIFKLFSQHPFIGSITKQLEDQTSSNIHLIGLKGSLQSIICAQTFLNYKNTYLVILSDKEEAAYFYNDLTQLINDKNVLFFPSSYKRSIQYKQLETSNIVIKTEVLNKISSSKNVIIVTYPEAIVEKVITKSNLKKNTLQLNVGEKVSIDFINDVLNEYNFERTDFVYKPGQFSIRGSIIDVFSFSDENPFRIDFFGDEVETIRSFDVENQLSKESLKKIRIIPNIQTEDVSDKWESLFDFISKKSVIFTNNVQFIADRLDSIYNKTLADIDNSPKIKQQIIDGQSLIKKLQSFSIIEFNKKNYFEPNLKIDFNSSIQPNFNKNLELLSDNIYENILKGYKIFIISENEKQILRLNSIFKEINSDIIFTPLNINLHEGFIDNDLKACYYTDHQIFNRYHKFTLRSNFIKKQSVSINTITDLQPGDYVVHIDHGIGRFGGLEKIETNGKTQETIKLIYKDNDILYVSIHSLHRISKYKGKESSPPKIYKLGSGAWQKIKLSTKKKVKDIAKDLISLYAKRKQQVGFQFSPDSYMNRELEASFIYEDTPDQNKATQKVREDMESNIPMDRLICGDVGFGKTEIAIRAAFKAVSDNKQVAILVPTTILALQHFSTFSERLKKFPCTIDYLNRLKTAKVQKDTIKKLEEGKVDIIIGTHRLLSKDIKFKDLGLFIIDEEQKFGVSAKERLKQFKINVDTLTLTATPIPRTLQFSLMGARDLSIINTPPPNRHPILTELYTFSEDLIKEAITYEVDRNGQVFFINNNIKNIEEIKILINRICPNVRTMVAHGQMKGTELESKMFDFIYGKYDVLIATTIIESGIDIPNANTIIINNAQNYGLSDLHQLRGRVGRSNKKAFCYLLAPPLSVLSNDARRRLSAIENYSELGSGLNIALQDLDIRGAGNMLGGEQSGFIADIGFETYNKILNEAIQELKETEFKNQFTNENSHEQIIKTQSEFKKSELDNFVFVKDCHIDTDLELLFPDNYISNISERIKLYRELDNIDSEENLLEFENKLKDRFGKIPTQSKELLNVVRLRWIATKLGIEKIILKNNKMIVYFISNQNSPFYQSDMFMSILNFVKTQQKNCKMQEKNNKLSLTSVNIQNISHAISTLQKIV